MMSFYEEDYYVSDRVPTECVPMTGNNITAVKLRMYKAVIRGCLMEYNPHNQMVIDLQCVKVRAMMHEIVDDVFETFLDMSSPYNMIFPVDSLADAFESMTVTRNNPMPKKQSAYRFLQREELWQMCSADPMAEGSRGENHIFRIMGLMALEEMNKHRIHYEFAKEYLNELQVYPDGYIPCNPVYICPNSSPECFPYNMPRRFI